MQELWSLATKDLRLLVRDKAGLFFTFFFPILYAVVFGTLFGAGGEREAVAIVIVDEDASEGSRAFVQSLADGGDLAVTPMTDRAAALDLVRRGKTAAAVVIPDGFGDATETIFSGEPMRLQVAVDPSRSAEAGLIQGMLTARAYERLQSMFTDFSAARDMTQSAIESIDEASDDDLPPAQRAILRTFLSGLDRFLTDLPEAQEAEGDDEPSGVAFNPVEIESLDVGPAESDGPRSPYAISFPQGIVWGIMGCAAGFGISLVSERNKGTLTRLRTAPLARSRVLLGKGLACFLTTIGVAAMLLVIARLLGVVPTSIPLLVAAVLSVAVCFVGIMMLLATIGRTEAAASGIGWAVLLVFAMFGGGMLPLMFMKGWMQTLSNFSPVKWAIYSLEGAIWRGFSPAEMLLPCAILIAIGIAGFTLGARLFDWSEG